MVKLRVFALLVLVALSGCGDHHHSLTETNGPTITPATTEHAATPTPQQTATPIANAAWAVGGLTILRSVDGGETWSGNFTSPSPITLRGIFFVDDSTGWALGLGDILHTQDGGVSWQSQRAAIPAEALGDFLAASFSDHLHGVVVGGGPLRTPVSFGGPSEVLVTDDGGTSWKAARITGTISALGDSPLRSVCLTSGSVGIASGFGISGAVTLLSDDAGNTWTEISSRACTGYVACAGDRSLWIVGGNSAGATICHSDDGGKSWTDQSHNLSAPTGELRDVVFVDQKNGWATGFDTFPRAIVVHTTDSGALWEQQVLPLVPGAEFMTPQAIAFESREHGLIVGSDSNAQMLLGPMALVTFDAGSTWQMGTFPADVFQLLDVALIPRPAGR
jgi:photosystem II stability/assembly factor-like uncharacterized protein